MGARIDCSQRPATATFFAFGTAARDQNKGPAGELNEKTRECVLWLTVARNMVALTRYAIRWAASDHHPIRLRQWKMLLAEPVVFSIVNATRP